MNGPNEQEIEKLLRHAPQPVAPQSLKEKLIMQTHSDSKRFASDRPTVFPERGGWLKRWLPVLAPAGLSLVCVAVLAVQQAQIRQLKQEIQDISATVSAHTTGSPFVETNVNMPAADSSAAQQEEITRLKNSADQLATEISQLEKMRAENQSLRAQLSQPPPGMFSQDELNALAAAKERAERIACVNNLKQIGLAARVFAGDVGDVAPPDFLSMSNELNTPKILVCPSDTGHQVATTFATYTTANCSYEYFVAGSTNWETDPERVMTRCPIHGTVGLCDGSVQQINTNIFHLIQRDGNYYLQRAGQ